MFNISLFLLRDNNKIMSNQQTFRDQTNIEYNNSRPKQIFQQNWIWCKMRNRIKKRGEWNENKIPLTQTKRTQEKERIIR